MTNLDLLYKIVDLLDSNMEFIFNSSKGETKVSLYNYKDEKNKYFIYTLHEITDYYYSRVQVEFEYKGSISNNYIFDYFIKIDFNDLFDKEYEYNFYSDLFLELLKVLEREEKINKFLNND